MHNHSPFIAARRQFQPELPQGLQALRKVTLRPVPAQPVDPRPDIQQQIREFLPYTSDQAVHHMTAEGSEHRHNPMRLGVVLSGGPAPGGHNVIWGLDRALRAMAPGSELLGFSGGPSGILTNHGRILSPEEIAEHANTGGFDLLGTGRTKLETPAQFSQAIETLKARGCHGLVIVGGDDSNTNAALLAEAVAAAGEDLTILGVPKTIDGDLKNSYVETSFGFDTAVRVYSEMIAHIARDTLSARKYYHFIRLMGRSASHVTLEAAFQTQPNLTIIAEEVAAKGQSLAGVVNDLAQIVKARAAQNRNFGIAVVPEGLVEFAPDMKALLIELNHILADHGSYVSQLSGFTRQSEYVNRKLSRDASYSFSRLPIDIQRQLLMDRDPHGNVVVSNIETEKLLTTMLASHLGEEAAEGRFAGKFGYKTHFLGYEGRCAAPTDFDASYAYALGTTAAVLAHHRANGTMAVVGGLARPVRKWQAMGVPLATMMTMETRHGALKPVIQKGLVELDGRPFQSFQQQRSNWAAAETYRFAGPIQYFGPPDLCHRPPRSLSLEQNQENPSF